MSLPYGGENLREFMELVGNGLRLEGLVRFIPPSRANWLARPTYFLPRCPTSSNKQLQSVSSSATLHRQRLYLRIKSSDCKVSTSKPCPMRYCFSRSKRLYWLITLAITEVAGTGFTMIAPGTRVILEPQAGKCCLQFRVSECSSIEYGVRRPHISAETCYLQLS